MTDVLSKVANLLFTSTLDGAILQVWIPRLIAIYRKSKHRDPATLPDVMAEVCRLAEAQFLKENANVIEAEFVDITKK